MEKIGTILLENQEKKETQEIQNLLENCRSRVKIIRENPWPLIDYDIDFSIFRNLSLKYRIPNFIISEIFTIIKSFGFVNGLDVTLDNESQQVLNDGKKYINEIIGYRENDNYENYSIILIDFFEKISKLEIIKDITKQNIDSKELPYGLFRFTSLFDIKVQNFSNLKDFLDFLYENLVFQENIFQDNFLENIIKNGGFPIDDISGKEKILRNLKGNISLGSINLFGKDIGLILRVIPGYAPIGLVFEIGLNIDGNSNNIFSSIGVSFQNDKAIIHTIQYSFYNIGIDESGLIETYDKTKNISGKKLQKFISCIGDFIFEKNEQDKSPIRFLLALTGNIIQNFGIKEIEVINPDENLWLNNHNPNRELKSIKKSGEAQYVNLPLSVGGKINPINDRVIFDLGELQYFLSTKIKSELLEQFSSSIGDMYISSDFFINSGKVVEFGELTNKQKDLLGENIYNIIRKIKNYA